MDKILSDLHKQYIEDTSIWGGGQIEFPKFISNTSNHNSEYSTSFSINFNLGSSYCQSQKKKKFFCTAFFAIHYLYICLIQPK